MIKSKQSPLGSAKSNRSVHDFSQSALDWEITVFDQAAYFAVVGLRNGRKYTKWSVLPWAVRYAKQNRVENGACLYAVSESGRFFCLDHEKWDEWVQRWEENRK